MLDFKNLKFFENSGKTRWFVAFGVDEFYRKDLVSVYSIVKRYMSKYNFESSFSEVIFLFCKKKCPEFHVSILWSGKPIDKKKMNKIWKVLYKDVLNIEQQKSM